MESNHISPSFGDVGAVPDGILRLVADVVDAARVVFPVNVGAFRVVALVDTLLTKAVGIVGIVPEVKAPPVSTSGDEAEVI